MPLLNSVTTPYAEALLQVVNENSQTEEMVSEVKQLLELINDSPELEMARIKQSAISDESSEASRAISQLRKEAVELAIKKALESLPNRLDKTTQENLVTQSINNIEVN